MPKTLLILPFDHRSSFANKILGYSGLLTKEQHQEIEMLKEIVFEGFLETRQNYANKEHFAILVDEQFGSPVIQHAKKLGIKLAICVEKSGRDEFEFEYLDKFGEHIEKYRPDYVKVLVRYNPVNTEINRNQLSKIKKLGDYCSTNNHRLIFELLVPPTESDLWEVGGKERYDTEVRPQKTVEALNAITQVMQADIWKLEGVQSDKWPNILDTLNPDSDVIVLGRGANKEQVTHWLEYASKFDRIIGFAIGRTIFMDPIMNFVHKNIPREKAIREIADNFDYFVKLWYKLKNVTP